MSNTTTEHTQATKEDLAQHRALVKAIQQTIIEARVGIGIAAASTTEVLASIINMVADNDETRAMELFATCSAAIIGHIMGAEVTAQVVPMPRTTETMQ